MIKDGSLDLRSPEAWVSVVSLGTLVFTTALLLAASGTSTPLIWTSVCSKSSSAGLVRPSARSASNWFPKPSLMVLRPRWIAGIGDPRLSTRGLPLSFGHLGSLWIRSAQTRIFGCKQSELLFYSTNWGSWNALNFTGFTKGVWILRVSNIFKYWYNQSSWAH